jgi:SIT4-associating protein SAP185/190
MFWRFGGYANVSTIDTLLDKSDTTLEELLDDSDLLDELRQHSAKLIEYLRGERVLKKLLDYIIAPSPRAAPAASSAALLEHGSQGQSQQASETPGEGGPEAAGSEAGTMEAGLSHDERERREKNRLRYANIACEIIVSETRSITDTLMENPQYLRDFWRFLERESPLDPYAATNFTRVNEMLLDKKTEEMVAFMTSTDNVVAKLLRHVDCPVIMDLLLKIVSLENIPGGQGIVDVWHAQNASIPQVYILCSSAAHTDSSANLVASLAESHSRSLIISIVRLSIHCTNGSRRLSQGGHYYLGQCLSGRLDLYWSEFADQATRLRGLH